MSDTVRSIPPLSIKFIPNEKSNPPGKLADAEIHFADGPLDGLKLIGFGIWDVAAAAAETSHFRLASIQSTASAAASPCSGLSSIPRHRIGFAT